MRADAITAPGAVLNQIWAQIRAASVCVAELTGLNANVLYELGLAHALGKPVVQITQNIEGLPFDMRHLRHIVYDVRSPGWEAKLQAEIVDSLAALQQDPASSLVFPDAPLLQRGASTANPPRALSVTLRAAMSVTPLGQPISLIGFNAGNVGLRPVSLTGLGLLLPDGQQLRIIRAFAGYDFPVYLLDGQGHSVLVDSQGLCEELKRAKYSGVLQVKGSFDDALGNRYTSEEAFLDLNQELFYNYKK